MQHFQCSLNLLSFVPESSPETSYFNQWQQDDSTFVSTKSCKDVEHKLKAQNLIIVTGHSGSGKSAIIHHIAVKYRKQEGWIVKLVNDVVEFRDMLSNKFKKEVLFVIDDPFGKAFLDEMLYNSWLTIKRTLISILGKHKLIMSCRNSVIHDIMSKGTFINKTNIVDINDLTDYDKRQVFNQYTSHLHISEKEYTQIAEVKKQFPLLCKLYSKDEKLQKKGLRFFKESIEVLKEEIKDYKYSNQKIYCALLLLVSCGDNICVDDIIENKFSRKKLEHALKLCKINQNTKHYFIEELLESLTGFHVKKICNKYHFNHDFVMEVTNAVLGTDFPEFIIQNADIGLLRKFVRIDNFSEPLDPLIIYLKEKNIDDLGKRFCNALFEESLLDIVLNPCMRNETVIRIIKTEIEDNPGKLELLLKKKEHISEKHRFYWSRTDLMCSKLSFLAQEKEISPICALIILSHTDLSLICLDSLQKGNLGFAHESSVFSAVCCNGSIKLLNMFSEEQRKKYLKKKWQFLLPIHIASLFHNYELLNELIQIGVDVNSKTDNNAHWTPLQLAAGNATEERGEESSIIRRNETIKLLLKNNANINLCDDFGISPLHAACENGHESTVQLLLNNGADCNLCSTFNDSPIQAAYKNGYDNVVKILIDNEANLNLCNKQGNSLLHVACKNGHEKVVLLLLEKCANINMCNDEGNRPFDEACANGHESIVHIFLEKDFDIAKCNEKGENPLQIAITKGQMNILQILLNKGSAINLLNKEGKSPLNVACEINSVSSVELLLNSEADINVCNNIGNSPLHVACENRFVKIVEVLLNNNLNLNLRNDDGNSPLDVTCENGYEDILEKLLSKGAKVNLFNNFGISPLHVACRKGHKRVVEILLKIGAKINLCNSIGNTPLYDACRYKHNDIVQTLLTQGADVNLFTKGGNTPLHLSSKLGRDTTVKILLKNNAKVNLISKNWGSPLHAACKGGYENTVKLLLKNGANVNLQNIYGKRPINVAGEHGHVSIVHILRKHGALTTYKATS